MTLRAGLILLGVGVSLLSACGQQHAATASLPSMRQATTVGSAADEQAGSTATATPGSDPPEAITDFTGFTSPSGNVGCYIDPPGARCDISDRDWSPPAPAGRLRVRLRAGHLAITRGEGDIRVRW